MVEGGTGGAPLTRVLIANRGEIAIRIARAAAGLGIESVAVYTPVDTRSLHTRLAMQMVELRGRDGRPADPVGGYLDGEELVRLAKEMGCDCVHPGYGFLAESPRLAELCAANGLTFIGPGPDSLALFGNKLRARELARSAGVPVIPGSREPVRDAGEAAAAARDVGYPVMLKAASGGGGRGMRLAANDGEMERAFERCASEALAAFGDGTLYVEKALSEARHIEVQVLGDAAGSVIHLFERDCSVQQRHQKVVEIAPAPNLSQEVRGRLHADATRLAAAARVVNAATVEFLVTPSTGEHFFIECNPRIQVEHTVTEQVLGIDLVEAQFRIAGGATLEELGLGTQTAVGSPRGFAVQARVVARGAG